MRAIDTETLTVTTAPTPEPGPDEVLIKVAAAGVNRADLLQRAGHYPPPPGVSEILGLEVAGTTPDGERVMALLTGGGYAEYVCAPRGQCLPIPDTMSFTDAAALPEALATAWLNLVDLAELQPGETVLIQGGSGGVGSVAIQLAHQLGAVVVTTAGSDEKCKRCRELGAQQALNYHTDSPAPNSVDVILDILGAGALDTHLKALRPGGRMVTIGMQKGRKGTLDLGQMLTKRLTLIGSTLRALPVERKSALMRAVAPYVGTIRPQVYAAVPFDDAARAHTLLDDDQTFGSIVLTAQANAGANGTSGNSSAWTA